MSYIDLKCGPIDFYGESGSFRRIWIAYKVFYSEKTYMTVQSRDVGSYFTCLGYDILTQTEVECIFRALQGPLNLHCIRVRVAAVRIALLIH